jgi:hypothetical protein
MIYPKRDEDYHILQPLIDKAAIEEKTSGTVTRRALLELAQRLVNWAPNLYTSSSSPSYSEQEKIEARALLEKYGLVKFCNLSPRYKKATLQLIRQELAKEA